MGEKELKKKRKEKKDKQTTSQPNPSFLFFCAAQISAAQTTSRPANSLSPLSRH
jgi:hypothetical protein